MSLNRIYQEKAHALIPGGAHTYSRGDDQYPLNAPPVLEKGEGCYVWDLEGNRYLDYGMALRAVTLGYGYAPVAEKAIDQIWMGNNLTRASKIEVEAAEAMVRLVPGMDQIKFAKNGSTVTTAAVKLSRAYTNRKYIARCAQHPFFSFDDWFIGDTVMAGGIPEENKQLTLQFNFNDIASLEALFQKYPDQIACVILEPATTIEPIGDYLHQVKRICHDNGSVFILDEMITGFRWGFPGAQTYYGIVPDLCTFGKGIANGFSVAALMGKKEIMDLGGLDHDQERVFLISTTHGAEMSGLGALVETIKVYETQPIIEHLWDYGRKLVDGMNTIAYELGIQNSFFVEGVPVSPNYMCKDAEGNISMEFRTLFSQEMLNNGVLMPWIAISYAHGHTELEMTLDACKKALVIYKQALEKGVDSFLIGRPIKPVFRKYNNR